MGLKQINHGSAEYRKMVELRNHILRQPLGLSFTEEELEQEKNEILIAAFDEDEIIGCCILTKFNEITLRLRQMAVLDSVQGTGIGASIVSFAENIARDKGFKYMVMHARDTALGFYEKFGYSSRGDVFIEVNLPHHVMEKELE
jgi:N-acetylglutamate synthase-like GNAT family acetyltransferase